ncbi:MAG: hypothetical protein WA875_07435, partial [Candidatus Acidiferrales bacterium]
TGTPERAIEEAMGKFLVFEDFFDLADFLLHFAADLFALPLVLEAGIIGGAPDFFLNLAFHFVRFAFDPIAGAVFHSPVSLTVYFWRAQI